MADIFVPGRLCLFGEHSDWAGELRREDRSIVPGACIVIGTNQGLQARASRANAFEISSRSADGVLQGPFRVAMQEAALLQAAKAGEFFSYATGVALVVSKRWRVGGLQVNIEAGELPVQRGLSSSAAACVLVARAFNMVYDLGMHVRDEMEIAYRGERISGSQCGRMDQACAYGRRPVLLRFDGDALDVQVLRPKGTVHMLIVDLKHAKDTRRILSDLHQAFVGGEAAARAVMRNALGKRNAETIAAAELALRNGDAAQLGKLMTEAQKVFDRDVAPGCPTELAAPRLRALLAQPVVRELTWGGKGVGSQGDGAAQLVCRGVAEREQLAEILQSEHRLRCLPLTIEAQSNR